MHKSAGAFGTEFPWAKAQFTCDGETFKDVGVRYKGNFTYVASAQMLRRPLKIDLDHYAEDQRLNGQKKINLSNGVTDPAPAARVAGLRRLSGRRRARIAHRLSPS